MSTAKPAPHQYVESKAAPGTCATCRLIKRNAVHQGNEPEPGATHHARYDAEEVTSR